ncbi:acetyl-CoA carboxylase biotin carboxyl carrier protein [Granulicatella adiacens ATCC 49175]|jgi:acetyl-CoA carboxylase, biotin carboxyl carrier protein|uniref:Biotin carboxyl carrier protein of acetyl-CoA carboxylase n=1 Tax=Granulicatella adiacens ATCC 49175 TaxID=638301 RepID=C8NED6_9LACT|nr:acetyl-CoA carboxylase biotin carboxyl carrier protein [Granulicatella adiacens]RKW27725.1 MAG: acetyl-CoA carboxylase biotin carboxyl carrier protein [Granulicatella sp.]EEW38037.1 acetyl-CoA carboxylase, biotin carboxyl carrier protein [Granulicatella adiacens ATCC 49175]MCT2160757.1 acetyl-CoA carboxylase biotin carboxyl carrier protein [Granulicatella adiacens]UAK93834.1 acetyl-CoA carboxylase biotin carboxyl carrier protein [Granulicatella adiacens]UWP38933.1 acetyl-CoA carboxylase bio
MNVEEIKELMTLFNESNMTEFHLSNEEFEVQFSKREEYPQVVSNAVAPVANVASPVVEVAPVNAASSAEAQETPQVATDAKYITSPIVGVVYLQSSPDADPFVQVGKQITSNDTVCIVEAMKIMNEIKSDFNGEVVEVLVENGQMVDFGQKLFAIR